MTTQGQSCNTYEYVDFAVVFLRGVVRLPRGQALVVHLHPGPVVPVEHAVWEQEPEVGVSPILRICNKQE